MLSFNKNTAPDSISWEVDFVEQRDSYDSILTEDVFQDWETIKNPADLFGFDLRIMLGIAFARAEPALITAFAQRVKTFIDRAFTEDLFELCRQRHPRGPDMEASRAQARLNLAYAELALQGQLSTAVLMESVAEFEQWLKPEYGSSYADPVEYDYLRLTLLCLVCGEVDRARALHDYVRLKKKRYNEYFDHAITAILDSPDHAPDLSPLREYLANISYRRLPAALQHLSIKPVIHQFELGLLYAVLDRQVALPDCNLGAIVDIVNPPR